MIKSILKYIFLYALMISMFIFLSYLSFMRNKFFILSIAILFGLMYFIYIKIKDVKLSKKEIKYKEILISIFIILVTLDTITTSVILKDLGRDVEINFLIFTLYPYLGGLTFLFMFIFGAIVFYSIISLFFKAYPNDNTKYFLLIFVLILHSFVVVNNVSMIINQFSPLDWIIGRVI